MKPRTAVHRILAICALTVAGLSTASTAAAHSVDYDLPSGGVLLEGIGIDQHAGVVYVSGVNDGGDIYRGRLGDGELKRWVDASGTTGRGIDVDAAGRVFVAGGPTGTVRVFDRGGALLATVATGVAGSYLNDVAVAPDGSVLITDSSLPKIWQVTRSGGSWSIAEWKDVSETIAYTPSLADFDLGGIVITGRFVLTSQGTTGQLWRIDRRTKAIVEVDLGDADIVNADGIVLKGRKLWVVQNFSRQISEFRLDRRFTTAELRDVTATPATRTFTTAKLARGRLLVVDSQFGFDPAAAPAQNRVVSLRP
jgi:sugar lactone lactonase YvrE